MDGIRMSCVYSWNCDKAKGLGVSDILLNFAKNSETDVQKIQETLFLLEIGKFYKKIAEINSMSDPFDKRIVSYYWTGQPNLAGELWHNYTTLLPLLAVPFSFLKIGLIDNCLARAGEVVRTGKGGLVARYRPLIKNETGLAISETFQEKNIEKVFGGPVKKGDLIIFHFSNFTGKINFHNAGILDKITKQSLNKFNAEHK
ncbi:MAG: hypothetical protein HZC14_03755 [Candidatus Niyogibacteria bacterium]|nr:hypothetical protein [Candidatus Niyogibacteria bacterium]